jgi:hypothetical protein
MYLTERLVDSVIQCEVVEEMGISDGWGKVKCQDLSLGLGLLLNMETP